MEEGKEGMKNGEPKDPNEATKLIAKILEDHGIQKWALIFEAPGNGHGFHHVADYPWLCFWLDTHAKMTAAQVMTAMHQEQMQAHKFREKLMGRG